jgi:hypothetical protein
MMEDTLIISIYVHTRNQHNGMSIKLAFFQIAVLRSIFSINLGLLRVLAVSSGITALDNGCFWELYCVGFT